MDRARREQKSHKASLPYARRSVLPLPGMSISHSSRGRRIEPHSDSATGTTWVRVRIFPSSIAPERGPDRGCLSETARPVCPGKPLQSALPLRCTPLLTDARLQGGLLPQEKGCQLCEEYSTNALPFRYRFRFLARCLQRSILDDTPKRGEARRRASSS